MLRILRAMHFLVLIMVEVPARMATEREGFEQTAGEAMKLLEDVRQFTEDIKRKSMSDCRIFRGRSRRHQAGSCCRHDQRKPSTAIRENNDS